MRGFTLLIASVLVLVAMGCGTVVTKTITVTAQPTAKATPVAKASHKPAAKKSPAAKKKPAAKKTHAPTPQPAPVAKDYAAGTDILRYMDKAMVKLATITRLWSGDIVSMNKAADLYLALSSNVPPLDGIAANDFAAYAADVGYYLGGDGSVNRKQLDASRHNAEVAIAAAKLP